MPQLAIGRAAVSTMYSLIDRVPQRAPFVPPPAERTEESPDQSEANGESKDQSKSQLQWKEGMPLDLTKPAANVEETAARTAQLKRPATLEGIIEFKVGTCSRHQGRTQNTVCC